MELAGKVAIVTGGGGAGSGRAICLRLARAGATVIVADVDEAGGYQTVRQLEALGAKAVFFRASVAVEAQVKALFDFSLLAYGGVDLLVNDASASPSGLAPLYDWESSLQVDLAGTLRTTALALPVMAARGGGAIVNLASTSALSVDDQARFPAYDAAKAAVIRLTTALAPVRESHRVRVNCVVPAWIGTPKIRAFYDPLTPKERRRMGAPATLLSPDEIAEAVLRLATDDALAGRLLVLENGRAPRLLPASPDGRTAPPRSETRRGRSRRPPAARPPPVPARRPR